MRLCDRNDRWFVCLLWIMLILWIIILLLLYYGYHVNVSECKYVCDCVQEKLYKELMEVALKKQSEIQQIIVSAIASERATVLQLAADFQFDGNAVHASACFACSTDFSLILHSSNEPSELSQWLCHDDSTIKIVVIIIIIIITINGKSEKVQS